MSDLEKNPKESAPEPAADLVPRMDRRSFLLSLSGGAFVVAAGGLLAGCGGGGGGGFGGNNNGGGGNGGGGANNSFPAAVPAAVTQTITAAGGGTITIPNTAGGPTLLSIFVPPGTFVSDMSVTVTPISNGAATGTPPAGLSVVSPFTYEVSAPGNVAPGARPKPHVGSSSSSAFANQATITIAYSSGATGVVVGENYGGTPPLHYSPDGSSVVVSSNLVEAGFIGPGVTYVALGVASSSSTSTTSSTSGTSGTSGTSAGPGTSGTSTSSSTSGTSGTSGISGTSGTSGSSSTSGSSGTSGTSGISGSSGFSSSSI